MKRVPCGNTLPINMMINTGEGRFLIMERFPDDAMTYGVYGTYEPAEAYRLLGQWPGTMIAADEMSDICVKMFDSQQFARVNYMVAYEHRDGGIIHQHST